jgi:NAD(P)H-flavin reductase
MGMQTLADPAETHAWALPAPWRVAAVQEEATGVVTLALEPPGGAEFAFAPGQFNMLYAFGIGEVPISISGDPTASGPIPHTIRQMGQVTRALCALQPGGKVGVRGPYGSHWPVERAEGCDVVIIAGGIGLPPLRPALYSLLANRERYARIVLLYGSRTPDDLLFTEELAAWRSRFDLDVKITVDAAMGGWKGNVGVVPDLIPRATFDPATAVGFVVGPEIMMRFAVQELLSAGLSEDRVFLSMERNMQCAVAMCGHCQLGPFFVCRDGPVFSYEAIAPWFTTREV